MALLRRTGPYDIHGLGVVKVRRLELGAMFVLKSGGADRMRGINVGRMLLAGLAAGICYNIVNWLGHSLILRAASSESMAEQNIGPSLGTVVQLWAIWTVYGLVVAWLYAVMRPRFGTLQLTAVLAAVTVWLAGIVVPALPNVVLGFASAGMVFADLLVGLVDLMVAGFVAGLVYREPAFENVADSL
jgi:hypothetical protein